MMMPQNGTLLSADGESTVNIADLLGGEKTGEKYNMDTIAPKNGVFLNSKGEAVDITKAIIDFLAGGGSGGGGTVSLQALTITVNGTTYTYDGKTAIEIPINTTGGSTPAASEPLTITIGDQEYTYTGTEAVTLTIPAVTDNQALTIRYGASTYTYDGKSAVTVEITEPAEPEPAQALNITINGKKYSYDGSTQIDIVLTAAEEGAY
jgi:hypothetical protein|nr:MAG TPA: hypothetical protein [Caudoviricetes sp.]